MFKLMSHNFFEDQFEVLLKKKKQVKEPTTLCLSLSLYIYNESKKINTNDITLMKKQVLLFFHKKEKLRI